MTGAALALLVRDYLGAPPTYARLTDAQIWDYALEAAIELAEAALPESLRKASVVLTTSVGVGSYDTAAFAEIPVRILNVNVAGVSLRRCEVSELDLLLEAWQAEPNGVSTHWFVDYYTAGYPQIRLWPVPATAGYIIYVRYVGQPTAFSAAAILDWPLTMQYSIARYAAARSAMRMTEVWQPDKIKLWLDRWEADKAQFVARCNERNPLQTLSANVQARDRSPQQ